VLTNSEKVYDLAVADDGVWAASSGGLLRWKADGTNALFTTSDGLPVNHLRALLSPEDGNLWMAGNSAAAVSALDGDELASVDTYTRGDGVDIGESPALMRDDDGSVWVASLYGEQPILRFDGSLWRPPPLDTDHPALEGVRPQIASLLRARDGAAWAGLSEDGILRYDGEDWTRFGPDQGVPAESVRCLLEDRAGVMWAAAGEGGLLKFESDAGRWERVEFQQPDAPVYWISELPDGSLWASGDYFILRSEDGGERWRTVASPEVGLAFPRRAAQDEEGRVWVATDQGIAVRDGEQWRQLIRPGEVSSYSLGRIYRAPDGRLWVLPQYGGRPTMVDPVSGEVTPPPGWPGGMSNVVSLAFEGGGTWAGLNDGLARVEDGTLERWDATDGLPGSRINALLVTADTLWIGGSEGLGKLDLQSGQIAERVEALDGQYVDALTLAPDGSVWAGAHWGEHGENAAVYRFSGDDREVWSTGAAPLERESAWVNAIAAAEDGAMWVASDTGVYRWDGERWEGWGAAQGAPSSEMFTLLPHAGAMWMAGDGGMLGRWDSESGWQRFRAQGLTSDVLAIQVSDEGSLWLGTQDGLLRYGP
jgi:ligand-binding sensor domain-containing protein